jgi:hypothetical protein
MIRVIFFEGPERTRLAGCRKIVDAILLAHSLGDTARPRVILDHQQLYSPPRSFTGGPLSVVGSRELTTGN